MAKLDYFTIVIVAVCLAAAAFLVYIGLNRFLDSSDKPSNTQLYDDRSTYDDQANDDDYYLDDSDVATYNEEAAKSDGVNTPNTPTEDATYDNYNYVPEEETKATITSSETTAKGGSRTSTNDDYVDEGKYMVLAGTFGDKDNAERYAKELRGMSYKNASVERFDRGRYYVVLVDRFEDANDAKALKKDLKGDKVEAYVKLKRTKK